MVDKTAFRLLPGMYTRAGADERLTDTDGERAAGGCGARLRALLWTSALMLGLALTALTAVREYEAAALRREVSALAADLLLLRAQHQALQHKIEHRDIFKKIQMLENTIYADIDEESSTPAGTGVRDPVEKMDTLTVVGDGDCDPDDGALDDVFADDEEDTSGDYYMDYDRRKREEAKQNLVRLRPDDWIDVVPPVSVSAPTPETAPESAPARPRAQADGRKGADVEAGGGVRVRRSVAGGSADLTAPRALFKTNNQNIKKYESKLAEIGEEDEGRRLSPAARTPRNTDQEGGRRPFVAAHFHGNTSHLTLGVDAHYHGNGLVRTPHEEVHSVWWPAAWTAAAPRPRPTLAARGRVLVHRSGVYLVYVQVYYFDAHDTVGWVLHRTNVEREGRDALLQCTHAAPSVDHEDKPNSCFSAAALLLHAGDRLAVRNTGGERHAIMNPEKSFIGLVQLADADDPEAVEL